MVSALLSGSAVFSENEAFAQTATSDRTSAPNNGKSAEALVENTEVIIKAIRVCDRVSGVSEYVKPGTGNKLIAVQIVVDNSNGTEDWDVIPNYFKLKDSENNTYDPPLYFGLIRPTLISGIVDSGDLVKGWITFEISNDTDINTLKLRYEYNGYLKDKFTSAWIFLYSVKRIQN